MIALASLFALTLAAPPVAPPPSLALDRVPDEQRERYTRLASELWAVFDSTRGGFVTKGGVPSESAIELAFRLGAEPGGGPWRARALATTRWTMALLDTVGGGFVHGAKDADPSHPAFSKWTTDNARRIELALEASRITGDPAFRKIAERAVRYADRVLLDGRGGFVHGQVGDRQLVPESNGPMILTWLRFGAETGDVRYRDFAWKSLDRLWSECRREGAGMIRRGVFGELTTYPKLADQTEMVRAYALAAHVAGRAQDLERARTLADQLISWIQPGCGLRSEARPNKQGRLRAGPCRYEENSRAALALAELAAIAGESRYRDAAKRLVEDFDEALRRDHGLDGADWALALRAIRSPELPERATWRAAPAETPRETRFPAKKGKK